MKILVVGAGAVGGYFGAMLLRAGHEVTMVARGEHGRAIRERGLFVETPSGTLHVTPPVHQPGSGPQVRGALVVTPERLLRPTLDLSARQPRDDLGHVGSTHASEINQPSQLRPLPDLMHRRYPSPHAASRRKKTRPHLDLADIRG